MERTREGKVTEWEREMGGERRGEGKGRAEKGPHIFRQHDVLDSRR